MSEQDLTGHENQRTSCRHSCLVYSCIQFLCVDFSPFAFCLLPLLYYDEICCLLPFAEYVVIEAVIVPEEIISERFWFEKTRRLFIILFFFVFGLKDEAC